MTATIQLISVFLETGAISFLVYKIMHGLKVEIKTLQSLINNQNKTIETMDKRIQETEKIGELYKKLISDFPKALEDYQEVITKTKDQTIYQLKSSIEEQKFTIETLQSQTKGNDPIKIQRAASISKLFLNKENKNLLEFLDKLDDNKDNVINKMLENSDLEKLIESLGYKIEIIENPNPKEVFVDEIFKRYRVKNSTYTFNGEFYMITFDNEIKITNGNFGNFKNIFNNLI